MVSPGQNPSRDNSDFAIRRFQLPGRIRARQRQRLPGPRRALGPCRRLHRLLSTATLCSASLTYNRGPFTAVAAYELHQHVNRTGDEGVVPLNSGAVLTVPVNAVGVNNEWAAKVGAGYKFDDGIGTLQIYGIYEWMRRRNTIAMFNERARATAIS